MVDKQPPPSFLAPQAAIMPLKKLFIVCFLSLTVVCLRKFHSL